MADEVEPTSEPTDEPAPDAPTDPTVGAADGSADRANGEVPDDEAAGTGGSVAAGGGDVAEARSVAGSTEPAPVDEGEGGTGDLAALRGRLDEVAAGVGALADRMIALEAAVLAVGSTGQVAEAVDVVGQRVAEVARLGDRHNELIDKLHAENQALRKGELTQALAPIFRDLVRLSDQLTQLDEASPEPGRGDAAIAARQVIEILARSGVRDAEVAVGDTFDAGLHQGLGRVATDDPEADGCVASVRRAGFVGPDGRVLRAAEVEVWRYEAPAAAPEPDGPAADDPAADDATADGPAADDVSAADATAAPEPVAVPPPPAAEPTAPGDTEGDE